jgi:Pyridoxamine 5'-phosphate oxidase
MLDPDVRRHLDGTSLAHVASVLPDGSPHTVPVWVGTHGDQVVFLTGPRSRKARNLRRDPRTEWLEGDAAWKIIDQISAKYAGKPYPRGEERIVAVIEPERQTLGVG